MLSENFVKVFGVGKNFRSYIYLWIYVCSPVVCVKGGVVGRWFSNRYKWSWYNEKKGEKLKKCG